MSELKKYKLLNDGGFEGFENVTFPVEVDGRLVEKNVKVDHKELALIGVVGTLSERNSLSGVPGWSFILGSEIVEAD